MAHELTTTAGKTAFAYNAQNGKPWHGLGQALPGLMTAAEALEHSGLNFTVEKGRNTYGVGLEAPSFTTYRADTMKALGTVGDRYHILQNAEAFRFFDAVVDRGEAIYETAGAIKGGAHTFLLAKMPERIRIKGREDEEIEQYVMLMNTHDGSLPLIADFTPIRVVCNNTLQHALRFKNSLSNRVRLRHTANLKNGLEEAAKVLGLVSKYQAEMVAAYEHMIDTPFSDAEFDRLLHKIYPMPKEGEESTRTKNIHAAVTDYYHTGPGQATQIGNRWGAYNAITGYLSHKPNDDEEARFAALFAGSAAKKMETAFHALWP
jgi:phage/plasmid-like protein (TIGR03299 family)